MNQNEPIADFYVAPDGNDSNPGTFDRPFQTIAAARDAVRTKIPEKKSDITVLLKGGIYYLDSPVCFTPVDTMQSQHAVTYAAIPGERPVLSGGRNITGWKKVAPDVWETTVPEIASGAWYPRQLFVNGTRAIRARFPHRDDNRAGCPVKEVIRDETTKATTLVFEKAFLKDWSNPSDIEVASQATWETWRKRVQSIDIESGRVTMAPPHLQGCGSTNPKAGDLCYFENSRSMLEKPGEWYADRNTGVVTYMARAGEDPTDCETIASCIQHLIMVKGAPGDLVNRLHFEGISCMHTDWWPPAHGFIGVQANFHIDTASIDNWHGVRMPAAIEFEYAHDCTFSHAQIAHCGGAGISIAKGCFRCSISRNEIFDCASTGVMIGEDYMKDFILKTEKFPVFEIATDNKVMNNHIFHCGIIYNGAVGIWVGLTDNARISHNEIHDLPYSGISAGWRWNPLPSCAGNNVIEYNHIHSVMKYMSDGGGIYTLGLQPGTIIRNNLIHDVRKHRQTRGKAANLGIYLDEGSTGFVIEDNITYETHGGPLRMNRNRMEGHLFRNNSLDNLPSSPDFPAEKAARTGIEPESGDNMVLSPITSGFFAPGTTPWQGIAHVWDDASDAKNDSCSMRTNELWYAIQMQLDFLRSQPGADTAKFENDFSQAIIQTYLNQVGKIRPEAFGQWMLAALSLGINGRILCKAIQKALIDHDIDNLLKKQFERCVQILSDYEEIFTKGIPQNAGVAILVPDNLDTHQSGLDPVAHEHVLFGIAGHYARLWRMGYRTVFLRMSQITEDSLAKFKAAILPMPLLFNENHNGSLYAFVTNGGLLFSDTFHYVGSETGSAKHVAAELAGERLFGARTKEVYLVKEPTLERQRWNYPDGYKVMPALELSGCGDAEGTRFWAQYLVQTLELRGASAALMAGNDVVGAIHSIGAGKAILVGTYAGHAELAHKKNYSEMFFEKLLLAVKIYPDRWGNLRRQRRIYNSTEAWFYVNGTHIKTTEPCGLDKCVLAEDLFSDTVRDHGGDSLVVSVKDASIGCLILNRH